MARATKITEYLRHNFTEAERLQMGSDLAEAYSTLQSIEEEESVVKAQFKERKAGTEQKIGSLSRELAAGFTMQNVECSLKYDDPNPFEVSYYRNDTGERVKTRAMTEAERQAELPLGPVAVNPENADGAEASAEESAENVKEFFGAQDATATDMPEPLEDDAVENLAEEFDHDEPEEDEPVAVEEPEPAMVAGPAEPPKGRGRRPKGFDKPTNQSVDW